MPQIRHPHRPLLTRRPAPHHPAPCRVATAHVPASCRWHLSGGTAHPHGDGSAWRCIPPPGSRGHRRGGAPKRRFEAVTVMASEGMSVQMATRVLNVSECGYYAWYSRLPALRSLRHSWLTEAKACPPRGTARNRRRRPRHDTPTGADLVDRKFAATAPVKLWVSDITEHPTREGKVYCAVVLDTYSRRVVGSDTASCPCGTRTCATVTSTSRTPVTSGPARARPARSAAQRSRTSPTVSACPRSSGPPFTRSCSPPRPRPASPP